MSPTVRRILAHLGEELRMPKVANAGQLRRTFTSGRRRRRVERLQRGRRRRRERIGDRRGAEQ